MEQAQSALELKLRGTEVSGRDTLQCPVMSYQPWP